MTSPTDTAEYFSGLDLGKVSDHSALAVLQRTIRRAATPEEPYRTEKTYAVRHLKRWQLGTAYTVIAADVTRIFRHPDLTGTPLAVDQTGVGRPVVELLQRSRTGAVLSPVTITAGLQASRADDGWHVPKVTLVSTLQVLFQSRRLLVAKGLAEAETLVEELENFRVKVTQSANETFGADGTGQHDDLVLAVAMAAWLGERGVAWECPTVVPDLEARREPFRIGPREGRRSRLFGRE